MNTPDITEEEWDSPGFREWIPDPIEGVYFRDVSYIRYRGCRCHKCVSLTEMWHKRKASKQMRPHYYPQ